MRPSPIAIPAGASPEAPAPDLPASGSAEIPPPLRVWVPESAPAPLPPVSEIGGKAYALARLLRAGAPVPPFFVVPASVPATATATEGGAEDAARRRAEVLSLAPPPGLLDALRDALSTPAFAGERLAVRSSATAEDGERSSFAGQFETVLNVPAEPRAVWEAVRRVWASAWAEHAQGYRRERGEGNGGMAVVVQRLVDPAVSGVAFSVDPVTGERDVAVVSAVYGLGEGLVGGALDADTYRVAFRGPTPRVAAEVAAKDRALRPDAAGGVRMEEVGPALRGERALSDDEARRVAGFARTLAAEWGRPQDVEWALAEGEDGARELFVLQARPVTAALPPGPVPGERRTWDNENVVESLPGVTLPLTYSVARRAFAQVYVCLAEASQVPAERVAAHEEDFRSLFGLVRGRVHYHSERRQRILALLPGMVMRGGQAVPVAFPPDPAGAPPPPQGLPAPLLLASRAFGVPGRLLRDTARADEEVDRFRARMARELEPLVHLDLSRRTPDQLLALYRQLDREVLAHWHGPQLSDSLMSHWMLVLAQMLERWLPGVPPEVLNELLAGEGGIVSTEPVRRMAELGARARGDERLRAVLESEPDDAAAWARLTTDPALREVGAALRDYLHRFGDRCTEELKLEAPTYADDPGFLVRLLRAHAASAGAAAPGHRGEEVRARAEADLNEKLGPGQRVAFFAVVDRIRRMMRDRENLRYERTRAFGVLRRLFRALGARLAASGALDGAKDVFYLGVEEIADWLDGVSATGDLRPLVAARRAEFERYARLPDPPDRFVTEGPPAVARLEPFVGARAAAAPSASGALQGMGCSAGTVRAPVRVVHDPRHAGDLAGRILVARQTDPGWTLLFTTAAGVLVQHGSMLSHAAIVAREMGIPCVVGIPELLSRVTDGEVVEMDGATGAVRKVG